MTATPIQRRIDKTRRIVEAALARAAVRKAEADIEQARVDGDSAEMAKARTRLRHARARLARSDQ